MARVLVHKRNRHAALAHARRFTGNEGAGAPDGLKTDIEGNIWSTSPGGIRILSPDGNVLGQIKLPQIANNLAWGDADGRTLYICAHEHIYRLRTLVQGSLPLFRA